MQTAVAVVGPAANWHTGGALDKEIRVGWAKLLCRGGAGTGDGSSELEDGGCEEHLEILIDVAEKLNLFWMVSFGRRIQAFMRVSRIVEVSEAQELLRPNFHIA